MWHVKPTSDHPVTLFLAAFAMRPLSLCLLLACLCACAPASPPALSRAVTAAGTKSHNGDDGKVYLRSVTALVFSENARAKSRHGLRQPQLQCVGGSAAGLFWGSDRYPRVVQCANVGYDGRSIQWRCEATLVDGLEFGDTHVICEGYDGPGDEYITAGSCRLEYTLNYTQFVVTFVHVVYGSALCVAMLWFYWQMRWWMHSRVEKVAREARQGDARVGGGLSGASSTYGATGSSTG